MINFNKQKKMSMTKMIKFNKQKKMSKTKMIKYKILVYLKILKQNYKKF